LKRIYNFVLVQIFQGESYSANGEEQESPGDDALEVVKAGSPREERVTGTVNSGDNKTL